MKVALLFDGASAYATKPDQLILGTVEAIEQSLVAEGNEVGYLPVLLDGKWIEKLRKGKFDLAFNMCEGIDGIASLESAVIAVLELFKIPFTGASSYTTAICLRKPVINGVLEKNGLPIPRFASIRRGEPLVSVGYPAIVKPAAEDASLGVEQRSVVRNTRQLAERVGAMLELWDEVIVQRYVDGREVNVGILGDAALPIAEIDFGKMPRGRWRIVTYQSKWAPGSIDDIGGAPRCPARLPARVANEVRRVAVRAWKLAGGTGYGRVDMRIDANGQPWILEVNANPDIAPDAGLARMARVVGIEYAALIRNICELGLARSRETAMPEEWILAQKLSGVELLGNELDLFAGAEAATDAAADVDAAAASRE
jgi:D-alanine-D-alanine ligase